MDKVDKKTRSRIMARVKSRGNKSTEQRLRAMLVRRGISGWKVTPKNIEGNPDFAFPGFKVAVFVDGCFWHGCPKCCRMPETRRDYWERKIGGNAKRDKRVSARLRKRGWSVIRIWEHEIRDNPERAMARIERAVARRAR